VSRVALVARQVRYEDLAFWRNPVVAVFTFAFPLIFMVLAQLVLAGGAEVPGTGSAAFYTPAILAFSVVNVCFVSIAMTVSLSRDEGVLKRSAARRCPCGVPRRATAHAVIVTLVLALIVVVSGGCCRGIAGVRPGAHRLLVCSWVPPRSRPGLAVVGLIPNAHADLRSSTRSCSPVRDLRRVRAHETGRGRRGGDLFPVRHLAHALHPPGCPRPALRSARSRLAGRVGPCSAWGRAAHLHLGARA